MRSLTLTALTPGLATAITSASAPGTVPEAISDIATQPSPVTPIIPIPSVLTLSGEAALGKDLFSDRRVSGHGRLSCASCHDVGSNGADTRFRDVGDNGSRLPINTNTVFNAALSFRLNWEGDIRMLVDQTRQSLLSSSIMGSSPAVVIAPSDDPLLDRRFRQILARPPDSRGVEDTLAACEATLLTLDSRFDRLLRGDHGVLDAVEQVGYATFEAIGCIACHQGVGIDGNLWQRHGIFSPVAGFDFMVLRVPSPRNVAATPLCFQDGNAPTLIVAVSEMARA